MLNLRKKDYIISIATIGLTAVLYILLFIFKKASTVFIISSVFVFLSEMLFFACIYLLKESREKAFVNFIAGIYMVISSGMSILAYSYFNSKFILFIVFEVLFFIAAYVFCGFMIYKLNKDRIKNRVKKEKHRKEISDVKKADSLEEKCEKILYDYMIDEKTFLHKDKINSIYEEVCGDIFQSKDKEEKEEIFALLKELDTLLRKEDDKALEIIKSIEEKFID